MSETKLPKTVASHIELYPLAFATPRGLEYLRPDGKTEVLVALRQLHEAHPWLPRSHEEAAGASVAAPVEPEVIVVVTQPVVPVEVVKEIVLPPADGETHEKTAEEIVEKAEEDSPPADDPAPVEETEKEPTAEELKAEKKKADRAARKAAKGK